MSVQSPTRHYYIALATSRERYESARGPAVCPLGAFDSDEEALAYAREHLCGEHALQVEVTRSLGHVRFGTPDTGIKDLSSNSKCNTSGD